MSRMFCGRLNVEMYGESVSMNHSHPYEEVHIARRLEVYFLVFFGFAFDENA